MRLLDKGSSTKEKQPKIEIEDFSRWMTNLPHFALNIPICQLSIPGSHDSGATEVLCPLLPVANDEKGMIAVIGRIKWIRKGIRRWAITQRLSIFEQLCNGIRYFDLRVSHPPAKLRDLIPGFFLVHALYGPSVKDVLEEIKIFSIQNPMEVILLDVNHIFGMTLDNKRDLLYLIGETLGWNSICPFMETNQCTVQYMRNNQFQFIVFVSCDSFPCMEHFWPQTSINSPWPNTNRISTMVEYSINNLQSFRPGHLNQFFVTQGILTAQLSNVIISWRSTLESALAHSATTRIKQLLDSLPPEMLSLLNVVMVDFVDFEFSELVIRSNFVPRPAISDPKESLSSILTAIEPVH